MLTTELESIQSLILDDLADGQWHPVFKIRKNIAPSGGSAKITKETLIQNLEILVDKGYLLKGNNESYRFTTEQLILWREKSPTLDHENKQYHPRWFGGILEDDGWALAKLKKYDLIHFRVTGSPSRKEIATLTSLDPTLIQIDEENLYRVFSQDGKNTYSIIQSAKETKPEWGISGIRLEKDLWRRDINELPKGYSRDLCQYYGSFAKVLLRSNMSSITKHLPDPDDIQQQIYLWIIEAIQRYDDSTSIPFGAYLGTVLQRWVFNLNRKAFGRGVADAELKHSRAITEFKTVHNRKPTIEELAIVLDSSVESIEKDTQIISTVNNLRSVGTIHTEDSELPLPATGRIEDQIEKLVEKTILSATLATSALKLNSSSAGAAGLIAIYYQTWGASKTPKKVSAWLRSETTKKAAGDILLHSEKLLKESENL